MKCPSLLQLMGVLLLLSQERWQKFVSFGFDHIISGFCYLIRQKFKLTSFSVACFGVSCTVWSGFGNFSMEGRKGNLCLGTVGRKEGKAIYLSPWGSICFPEKLCHEIKSPDFCGAQQFEDRDKEEGPSAALGRHRTRRKG